MSTEKYWDCNRGVSIACDCQGCALADWPLRKHSSPFAVHPAGFRVFLAPEELTASDEYAEADPYSVEEGLDSDFHRRRFNCTLDLAKQALAAGPAAPTVLDIGCGQGHLTGHLKSSFPSADMSALDYSVSAIEYACRKFSGIDFCVANAYLPPYAPAYFDLVICNNLWEHVPDPLRLLGAMARVLKPEGHLIISTPSRYRLNNVVRALLGKPVALMSSHHVTEYSVGQVIEQLRHGGFQVISCVSGPLADERLALRTLKSVARLYLKVIGSQHSPAMLESTVFYRSRRIR